MDQIIKSELISFVDEYNRVCEGNFDYEVKDELFIIITEGFITRTFINMFMKRFSEKELLYVILYTGEHLEMVIEKL